MKKIAVAFILGIMASNAIFACKYNEKTHKLTECKKYIENQESTEPECKEAHRAYNKYVALKVAEKTKEKVSRLGNKLSQYIGEKMDESENTND